MDGQGHGGAAELFDDSSDDFVQVNESRAMGDARQTRTVAGQEGQSCLKPLVGDAEVVFPETDVTLHSSFSVNKVHTVFSSFVGEKKELLQSIGFGGLMAIQKQPKISRRLAFWLLSNLDLITSRFALRRGVWLKLSEEDVNFVLGLPLKKDSDFCPKISASRASELVKAMLSLGRNSEINLDYVESLLTRDYGGRMTTKEKNAFKIAVVIFADAYLLAPRAGTAKANHSILLYLADPNSIQEVNWCGYVLDVVKEASIKVKEGLAKGKKTVSLDCCLMFLEVFYLDNLDIGVMNPSYFTLPRVADYTYEKMKSIIAQDKESTKDGKFIIFGKLKVRASGQVVYKGGSGVLDRTTIPHDAATQEVPDFVTDKFRVFKEELQSYNVAYLEQVEMLVGRLERSISEYYQNCPKSEDSATTRSSHAVGHSEVQDGVSGREHTPISLLKGCGVVTTSPITVASSSPLLSKDYQRTPTSTAVLGFSAGPAFDKSGRRGSGSEFGLPAMSGRFGAFSLVCPGHDVVKGDEGIGGLRAE